RASGLRRAGDRQRVGRFHERRAGDLVGSVPTARRTLVSSGPTVVPGARRARDAELPSAADPHRHPHASRARRALAAAAAAPPLGAPVERAVPLCRGSLAAALEPTAP